MRCDRGHLLVLILLFTCRVVGMMLYSIEYIPGDPTEPNSIASYWRRVSR